MKCYRVFILFWLLPFCAFTVADASKASRGESQQDPTHDGHILTNLDQTKWGPAPPFLAPGSEMALLYGDPSKAGVSFALLAKLPNGYKIPPHWHSTDEHVTVLKGVFMMGLGEKFNEAGAHALREGGFAKMPKGVKHYAWAKGETIVQVQGVGVLDFNYVNPADDPRNKSK
jgi:quercetin dioxygenase-like cupin family protein